MKITVYCIGHLKENYWKMAIEEYAKRIRPYASLEIVEVDDVPYKEGASPAIEEQVKNKEGEKVLSKLKPTDYLCALDLGKAEYDSPAFSKHLEKMLVQGGSNLSFVIGGSLAFVSNVADGYAVLIFVVTKLVCGIISAWVIHRMYSSPPAAAGRGRSPDNL